MKPKRRSKTRVWVVTVIIIIAAIAIAASAFLRPGPTPYESVVAKTEDITTYYSFSGNVETRSRQTVISEKAMQISAINYKEGAAVKKDDVLIKTTAGDTVKAKINGVVAGVDVEEDAQVMAGVKLMEIVDNNDLKINVKVDEYDIAALAAGKETTVKIGAINKEFKGIVQSISEEGQIVNGVTYFTATIDLAKDSGPKIGMSAEIKVTGDKAAGVVALPMTAIGFDADNRPYVLKKDTKGAMVKTGITTGINNGTVVEVKSGVASGETVFYTKTAATAGGPGFGAGGANRGNAGGGGI